MKKISSGILLLLTTSILNAQAFKQQTKLFAADRAAGNQFGSAVAISGNYAAVGAADISGGQISNSGECVYVFEKINGSWVQKQKLFPSDKVSGNDFGHAVSISGNNIIVGAPRSDNAAGAAYIFERNANGVWVEIKKLVANDPSAGDNFGYSVSVSGNNFVVGAPYDAEDDQGSHSLSNAGSVYFFSRHIVTGNWFLINKMVAYDRAEGAAFGFSVSISGIYAIVGAPYESKDTTGANIMQSAGAAYIYQRPGDIGGWGLVHKIVYWNRAVADNFGYSVAISGDALIVGSPFEDEDANQTNTLLSAGSAHIFERKGDYGWWWVALLIAPDRATGDNFGQSVSITKDMVVVGAPVEDENITGGNTMTSSGSAYIFKLYYDSLASGWRPLQKITAADRTANDWFGYAVAISDNNIFVGAPFQDKDSKGIAVNDAGAIYFFGQGPCAATTSSIAPSACKSYTSPSGKYTWTKSGAYKDTVMNNAGCDSIITINLTVIAKADTSVTVKGNTITANAQHAQLMWIDCATNGVMRDVPTVPSFTPTKSGSYAVHVNQAGCIGVSSCYKIVVGSSPVTNEPPKQPVITLPKNKATWKAFLEVNKIVAQDRTHNDEFGRSVSISGNYAVVGVPLEQEDAEGKNPVNGAGAAYIFKLDDSGKWKQLQKIVASDRGPGDNFGCSVGISGGFIVVGARYDHKNIAGIKDNHASGSAYIFELNQNGTWYPAQKITADPESRGGQEYFGTAVTVEGRTIVVSSPDHAKDVTNRLESNITAAGALYVFDRTNAGWIQTQKIVANDRELGSWLGNSVAICGNNIIAGAIGGDHDANGGSRMEAAGAAYIFERSGGKWLQTQKLVAADRSPYDEFGFSVAISGDYAVVGARRVTEKKGDEDNGAYTGNAYIFKRNAAGGWSQQMKIDPDDRTNGDYLGTAVGISGDYLIVSAPGQDTDSLGNYMPNAGAIYVYYLDKKGNWILSDKISTFLKHQLDGFGHAAAISDCNIIGTSWVDQTDEEDKNAITNAGSAHIFIAAGCNNDGRCSGRLFPWDKDPEKGPNRPKNIIDTPGNPNPVNIGGPKPKTDSVRNARAYDFSNVRICVDVIKKNVPLPPRPADQFSYSIPEIAPDGTLKNVGVIRQELAAYTDKMWSSAEVLTVGFFNDAGATIFIIDKIKKYAAEWEKYANVKFEFVDNLSKAKIKVGFSDKGKAWSWLGRDILVNPFGLATMNFGWFTNTSTEKDFRVTIMHEFGHALGFVHEHQSPAAEINWDKEKVYAFFAKDPTKWSRADVDANVFNIYNKTSLNYSAYDPFSIMHYFFPAGLTTDGTAFPDIDYISGNDIKYAKLLYPFAPSPKNTTGTLHTTDDCDEIDFKVEYNVVDTNVIEFILEPGSTNGKSVTWWKSIGIPSKGGVDIDMDIENGSVSNKKIPVAIIDNTKGISFWKAKIFGVHTLLGYKWNALPALIGGCRVRLTWRRDTCL